MSNKWLLDVFIKDNKVVFSLYDEETCLIKEQPANLYFYGYVTGGNPAMISSELNKLSGIEDAWVEEWRAPPFYDSSVNVVVFKTKNYNLLREILKTSWFRDLKVVNTFPHPLVEALYRAGVKPLTKINISGNEKQEWAPVEKDPELNYLIIGFENGYYTVETRNGTMLFWELDELVDYITIERFHVGFADPYLYAKLIETEPRINSITYRWVAGGAFNPSEYFEWSRLSYIPLSLMNNITIGKILTTIEALHARSRRFLVDKTHGRLEPWRTMRQLIVNDRGGVIYQPKPGLYWNVCQVDFKSLYPSIMVKYNVSGETIDRSNCSKQLNLPWTTHRVCFDEEGVVPASIKALIQLKDLYDELYKKTSERVYEYRKNAVKWILVASFGYLGYRNSLFGSVMAHEVVTSTSREIMRQARIVTEKEGYKVIHAIVDSVFIAGVQSISECECLKEKIEEKTGFKAKIEAHYTWIYIPRSLNSEKSVANKYYGLLSNGSFKVKGIMAIRGDTPLLIKRAQLEALEKLFRARNPLEMLSSISEAHRVIDYYVERIRRGHINPHELIVSRFSRVRGSYRKPPVYVSKTTPPYRLIYVNNELTPFDERSLTKLDLDKYIWLLEKARGELPRLEEAKILPRELKAC